MPEKGVRLSIDEQVRLDPGFSYLTEIDPELFPTIVEMYPVGDLFSNVWINFLRRYGMFAKEIREVIDEDNDTEGRNVHLEAVKEKLMETKTAIDMTKTANRDDEFWNGILDILQGESDGLLNRDEFLILSIPDALVKNDYIALFE